MSLTVKAFLIKGEDEKSEIRRFTVPTDVSSSFDYLQKKIAEIFPGLGRGNFALFWKDEDGDLIAFSTGEELLEALGFVEDGIFRVYIKSNSSSSEPSSGKKENTNQVHPGIVCDGCDGQVAGARYKCLVCPDYDLCQTCEAKGLHPEHNMMKYTTPVNFNGFPGFPFGGPRGPHPGPHPGPHGPHGPFFPPPHFRRWMDRFNRQWHKRNGQGQEGCPFSGQDPCGQQEEEQMNEKACNPEEYLQSVGQSVAAMLDPLGIDVEVDVEHGGRRFPSGGPRRGCRGRSAGRGGCGRTCGQRTQSTPGNPDKEPKKPAPQNKGEEEPMEKEPSAPTPMATDKIETDGPSTSTDFQRSTEAVNKDFENWTLLDAVVNAATSLMTTPTEVPPQTATAPTQPPAQLIYPPTDPDINTALQQMMAMGFHNEGGWLQQLLQEKNGNISQVLDAIQTRASSVPEGGHMA